MKMKGSPEKKSKKLKKSLDFLRVDVKVN